MFDCVISIYRNLPISYQNSKTINTLQNSCPLLGLLFPKRTNILDINKIGWLYPTLKFYHLLIPKFSQLLFNTSVFFPNN